MKFMVSDGTYRLFLKAATWFDARANADRIFRWEYATGPLFPLRTEIVADHVIEQWELEWRGTDAGPRPNRALWVRRVGGEFERLV